MKTHTTTDAAEARALEVLKSVGERDCYRATDHLPRVPQDTAIAAMLAFATAEAASGAGEREAGEPTLAREIAAQFFDKRDPLDRSFRDIAHNIRRGRYDDQDSVEIVRFTLAFVAREAASLPPATDPAMVERRQLAEGLARYMDTKAFVAKKVGKEQAERLKVRRSIAIDRARAAIRFFEKPENFARLEARIDRAAAPTIPATGSG